MIEDKSSELSEEYVKNCIALTSEMIERTSLLRNMAVVYAGRVTLDGTKG